MPLGSGKHTATFGYWLTRHLPSHTVYDDHGDSLAEENVAAIHGFCGREVSNVTRLADAKRMRSWRPRMGKRCW
jgi:hypothetical protein